MYAYFVVKISEEKFREEKYERAFMQKVYK